MDMLILIHVKFATFHSDCYAYNVIFNVQNIRFSDVKASRDLDLKSSLFLEDAFCIV